MKKRNLLLVILAVLLVFSMVMSCGGDIEPEEPPPEKTPEEKAAEKAAAFFGSYITNYTLSGTATIEKITIAKDTIKIDEIQNSVVGDHIYFSISKWEVVSVPTWTDDSYPSTGGTADFTVGFKVYGKITEAKPDNNATSIYGTSTASGFSKNDINATDCWMSLYLDEDGDFLVRTPFSKAGKDNGNTPVRGSVVAPATVGAVRGYKPQ